MVTTRVRIKNELLIWLHNQYDKQFPELLGIIPHAEVLEIGIRQLQSNITGKTFNITINKKRKCLIIKEI